MANYQIMLPEKVYFGEGCLDNLGNEATRLAARHALVVTDPGVSQAGLAGPVKTQLARAGLSVDVFADAEPEPTLPRLNAIAAGHRKSSYDLLVGIGGGSSMDTAKGLSVLLTHGGDGDKYLGVDKVPGPCIPVFAVPTTAGTGSEVTRNAIFGIPEKEVKLAIVSPYILPRIAFVDPSLTYTCPPKVTAATGMDALVHAIECYTSLRANNFTDAVALEAMRLIVANLRTAVKNGSDKEARQGMSEGSLIAGFGFGNASCAAVHALAYPLGSRFHVPHGVANGLLLPYVMEVNLPACLDKYTVIAGKLGVDTSGLSPQEASAKGIEAARKLAADIGMPARLRELGVPRDALEGMAVATMDVTRLLACNPKQLSLDDVRRIWQNAW